MKTGCLPTGVVHDLDALSRCMWEDEVSDQLKMGGAGCRYYTMIEGGQQKKDWSTAEKYYFQAVTVFPEGGALATLSGGHSQPSIACRAALLDRMCITCAQRCLAV